MPPRTPIERLRDLAFGAQGSAAAVSLIRSDFLHLQRLAPAHLADQLAACDVGGKSVRVPAALVAEATGDDAEPPPEAESAKPKRSSRRRRAADETQDKQSGDSSPPE